MKPLFYHTISTRFYIKTKYRNKLGMLYPIFLDELEESFLIGRIYTGSSEAFDSVNHLNLLKKLNNFVFLGSMLKYI